MTITEVELPGVKVVVPDYHEDYRGFFYESYSKRSFAEHGITCSFVQDNHSMTRKKGTLRGIHFQNNPVPQAKLVRCTKGIIKDVIVDLRKDSPTFKKWIEIELSEENRKQIFIPVGYGHAFLSLADNCEVQYKVTGIYQPALDRSILWNDPVLAIDWGIDKPILSEKDANAPKLEDSDINLMMADSDFPGDI